MRLQDETICSIYYRVYINGWAIKEDFFVLIGVAGYGDYSEGHSFDGINHPQYVTSTAKTAKHRTCGNVVPSIALSITLFKSQINCRTPQMKS